MTVIIEAEGLGKRFGQRWALTDCTLSVPAGHVVGLVGQNGAGKTTLLNLATGMLAPTAGTIEVLGGRPAAGPAELARVGCVAQDAPVYAGLSVGDHPVQLLMPLWVRPHLLPASHATIAIGGDISYTTSSSRHGLAGHFTLASESVPGQPGAWVLSSRAVNAAGHPVSTVPAACAAAMRAAPQNGLTCMSDAGVRIAVTYQPASDYWALQSIETGIFLAAALGLAGCCFWLLRPRR